MALPTYDKTKRRKSFEQLPKGAYVITIKDAREETNKSGNGSHLTIAFDIAEGEHKGFYQRQFEADTAEDKKWPRDAIYYISVPSDASKPFVWDTWNTFFADLEDSNNGFVFAGDVKTLKSKLIGGKFHNDQSEYNGQVYDHIRLRWTCPADDIRNGRAGKMPKDNLISQTSTAPAQSSDDFMKIPDDKEEEIPF